MQIIDDNIDFQAYLAEPKAVSKIRPALSYQAELVERFLSPQGCQGVALPWSKTNELIRLRPHELSLWPGFNGAGKSLIIGQVMLGAMAQGEKVLIASMEMRPVSTLQRMARQFHARINPTPTEAREFNEWTDKKLWLYDHVGSVKWPDLIGACRYAAQELGISQIVIDSLMRCGIRDDDYSGQKDFMDALCDFRLDHPVHIHLVAHSRKREDELTAPGKYDLKGTGTITDLADNVFTVFRNKRKEKLIEKGETKGVLEMPDTYLICDKQRNWEWEGSIGLWYAVGSMQYVEFGMSKPEPFIVSR